MDTETEKVRWGNLFLAVEIWLDHYCILLLWAWETCWILFTNMSLCGQKQQKALKLKSTQVHLCSRKSLVCNTMDNFGEFEDLWLWRNTCQSLKIPLLMGIDWGYIYFKNLDILSLQKLVTNILQILVLHISNCVNSFCWEYLINLLDIFLKHKGSLLQWLHAWALFLNYLL